MAKPRAYPPNVTTPRPSWRRSSREGYPLGGAVLVITSTHSRVDVDLACTIEDGNGLPVGHIQAVPSSGGSWQHTAQFLGGGAVASSEFVILRADRTPVAHVRRPCVRG